jgi:hypothetical protein
LKRAAIELNPQLGPASASHSSKSALSPRNHIMALMLDPPPMILPTGTAMTRFSRWAIGTVLLPQSVSEPMLVAHCNGPEIFSCSMFVPPPSITSTLALPPCERRLAIRHPAAPAPTTM